MDTQMEKNDIFGLAIPLSGSDREGRTVLRSLPDSALYTSWRMGAIEF